MNDCKSKKPVKGKTTVRIKMKLFWNSSIRERLQSRRKIEELEDQWCSNQKCFSIKRLAKLVKCLRNVMSDVKYVLNLSIKIWLAVFQSKLQWREEAIFQRDNE